MTPAEVVGLLFALCAVGLFFEHRYEVRLQKEAEQALREMMEIAKRDDEKGRNARMLLLAWATGPISF